MSPLPPIRHPGPVAAERRATARAEVVPLAFRLQAGESVERGLARGLAEAGCDAACIDLDGVRLDPFSYVMPAASPGPEHAAWYSDAVTPRGGVTVRRAVAIVGRRDGEAFVHCHGLWQAASAPLAMGHLLPERCVVADDGRESGVEVSGIGLRGGGFESRHDAETNFRLFRAEPVTARPTASRPSAPSGRNGTLTVLATLRPNQDVSRAIASLCEDLGTGPARLHGIGSLNGATFESAPPMRSYASELMIRSGRYDPRAGGGTRPVRLDVAVVAMDGTIHEGVLVPDENPVCVTFELVVVPDAAPRAPGA